MQIDASNSRPKPFYRLKNRVASIPLPTTNPNQNITIKFLASPINPSDVNMVQGTYPIFPKFQKGLIPGDDQFAVGGSEGVAEIVAVDETAKGEKVEDWVRIGSRVVMRNAGF
ncbi:mitochondrial 2-enoyl thioester reductase, partial [Physocladia obscura]